MINRNVKKIEQELLDGKYVTRRYAEYEAQRELLTIDWLLEKGFTEEQVEKMIKERREYINDLVQPGDPRFEKLWGKGQREQAERKTAESNVAWSLNGKSKWVRE